MHMLSWNSCKCRMGCVRGGSLAGWLPGVVRCCSELSRREASGPTVAYV